MIDRKQNGPQNSVENFSFLFLTVQLKQSTFYIINHIHEKITRLAENSAVQV